MIPTPLPPPTKARLSLLRYFLRGLTLTLAVVFLMGASFLGGYWYHAQEQQGGMFTMLQAPAFPLLDEAYKLITTRGLKDPPPDPALEYGMIRGMLQAYNDPYTGFYEPPVHELQTNQLEGKFGGIGVQIQKDDQGEWVVYPFPESPARQSGVRDGDRLLAVEEIRVDKDTLADVIQAAIRGPVGQRVKITIGHAPDYQPLVLSIERQEIAIPTVTWRLDGAYPQVGVIQVNLMAASTADEIQRAAQNLEERGATHFILDLRDNPGGYLTAGIDVARLFLKEGVIMQQQYRGREIESYAIERKGPLADIPLVVLINHGSASSAEIVAGALQAAGRAALIGAPSFGKDTIQLVFELSDKSSLHLTAARWWIPGLEAPLGGIGLQPDVLVDPAFNAEGIDLILQVALERLLNQ